MEEADASLATATQWRSAFALASMSRRTVRDGRQKDAIGAVRWRQMRDVVQELFGQTLSTSGPGLKPRVCPETSGCTRFETVVRAAQRLVTVSKNR
jgi:hypothetical protein